MKKNEYIEMLLIDNKTSGDKQKQFADVIDCVDIALSQTLDDFDIDSKIGLDDLFKVIELAAKNNKCNCVGPFEAAELIAEKLGTVYVRASKRKHTKLVNLEDFF